MCIAEMVLAELACGVAEIEQEPCERRRASPQIGGAARNFRQNHADAHRLHAGDEGSTPSRAALLGIVGHELCAFMADAIDVGRFSDRQALVINARLHPADVVSHDEKDVGLLLRRRCLIFSCATAGAAVTTAAMPTARSAAKAVGALVRLEFSA